jgi:hypothetical protein
LKKTIEPESTLGASKFEIAGAGDAGRLHELADRALG